MGAADDIAKYRAELEAEMDELFQASDLAVDCICRQHCPRSHRPAALLRLIGLHREKRIS